MGKIDDIIGQIPLIEESLERADQLYNDLSESKLPDAKVLREQIDQWRKLIDDVKAQYTELEDLMPISFIADMDSVVKQYRNANGGVVNLQDINPDLIKKAINPEKLARQLGFATYERMKAEIARDPARAINNMVLKFLDSWNDYKNRISDMSPYWFSTMLEDAAEDTPEMVRGGRLVELLSKQTIEKQKTYINYLTALSVLPEEIVLVIMILQVILNEDTQKKIDIITQEDDIITQMKNQHEAYEITREKEDKEIEEKGKIIEGLDETIKARNKTIAEKEAEINRLAAAGKNKPDS
jgi:hypothetical protein